jgi:hypothetical protein
MCVYDLGGLVLTRAALNVALRFFVGVNLENVDADRPVST